METGTVALRNFSSIGIDNETLRPVAERVSAALAPLTGALAVENGRCSPCLFLKIDEARSAGYTVVADGADVVITGANLAQTVRGAFAFLRDVCGVRCFTADGVSYPVNVPEIPADLSLSYAPPFELTEIDWFSPRSVEYALWNDITGTVYRRIPRDFGGGVEYLTPLAHTLGTRFCAAKTYFADHPDYFALRHGKRDRKQLCLSNPNVLKIVTDEVLALLREKHDPAAPLQIVSLSQADNLSFCRCPACRETDRNHRSHAGTLLAFVNAVARAVREAGYDNVVLETLAYQYTRTPPQGIFPEKNVAVRLCTIECCFSHPLSDEHCKPNAAFAADLRGWAALCDRLYVWDYGANYCHFAGLFPNFAVLAPNMRFFAEYGVKGIYAEGNYTLKVPDVAFGELRAYLQARLFCDPTADIESARADYLRAVYGDGGDAVGAFLDIVCAAAARRHVGIFLPMRRTLTLTKREEARCDALLDEAEVKAGEHAAAVRRDRLGFRYWQMKTRRGDYQNPFSYRKKRAALLSEIADAGVTRLSEMRPAQVRKNGMLQALYFAAYPLASRVLRRKYRL